jgi:hypothetical protein
MRLIQNTPLLSWQAHGVFETLENDVSILGPNPCHLKAASEKAWAAL